MVLGSGKSLLCTGAQLVALAGGAAATPMEATVPETTTRAASVASAAHAELRVARRARAKWWVSRKCRMSVGEKVNFLPVGSETVVPNRFRVRRGHHGTDGVLARTGGNRRSPEVHAGVTRSCAGLASSHHGCSR